MSQQRQPREPVSIKPPVQSGTVDHPNPDRGQYIHTVSSNPAPKKRPKPKTTVPAPKRVVEKPKKKGAGFADRLYFVLTGKRPNPR